MRQEILKLLKSADPKFQLRGLSELRDDCAEKHFVPSEKDFSFLGGFLFDEADETVRSYALILLTTVIMPLAFPNGSPVPPPHPDSVAGQECLFDWLWEPFRETSAVFGTAGKYLRDGKALIQLARRLPDTEWPKTDFVLVPLGTTEWEVAFNQQQQCQAVCFVGRLGLYGAEAIRRWTYKKASFDFFTQKKPTACPPDELDEEYHCIVERLGDGEENYYRTYDKDGVRTDYAIVQRFVVERSGGGQMIVIYIAGNTSLGTLGGVLWATSRRTHLLAPNGMPIPYPENIRRDSSLEGLLEVSAPKDNRVWTPDDPKLLKLTAADFTWSSSTCKWHPGIIIDCENGDPRKPVAIFFGEEKEPMEPNGQLFRLLVGICLHSRQDPEGRVDLNLLAKDRWVWFDEEATDQQLRATMATLKHRHKKNLHNILSNPPDLHLYADVKIRSVEPVAVSSNSPAQAAKKRRRRLRRKS